MKRFLLLLIAIHLTFAWAQTREDILPALAPPVILDGVRAEMRQPGFWISRHPYPDSLLMSPSAIEAFNSRIRRSFGTVTAIDQHSTSIPGRSIRNQINYLHNNAKGMRLYDATGNNLSTAYWAELARLENSSAIRGNLPVRFAIASSFANQRLVPTMDNLNKEPGDIYFDEIQNSGYDIGTPIVLYHNSRDGAWAFGATSVSSGWFRLRDLAIVSRREWQNHQRAQSFIVVLADKADLWRDASALDYLGGVRMGTRFEYLGESGDYYKLRLAIRQENGSGAMQEGYILRSDARIGYLPYTVRNAYNQAFKMLNHRYGWADINGDWDCSSMMIHIFACFGFRLPRNGASQVAASRVVHEFAPAESDSLRYANISRKAVPGISLLHLRGHIVLYLGEVDGTHYIIHNTSGYRVPIDDKSQYIYSIKGTVVSTMELGAGSDKRSLIKRMLTLSVVR
ncbi:MAG TPA: SH3 domain-containing protein [Candidatus Cloacimonadota bacterium]|nr:SH3 domain-containing protein [Candidatus Cloacimonadota bacterium]